MRATIFLYVLNDLLSVEDATQNIRKVEDVLVNKEII